MNDYFQDRYPKIYKEISDMKEENMTTAKNLLDGLDDYIVYLEDRIQRLEDQVYSMEKDINFLNSKVGSF